ncbi:hypothetical protein EPN44_15360 [bacterium]|nr:MAG: hypothetical protein EPN44_15360 [bacterium]
MEETNIGVPTVAIATEPPKDARVYPTTYGHLRPGERYRLPELPRWYRRSETAFVTDAMRVRPVEALEPHDSEETEEAARAS